MKAAGPAFRLAVCAAPAYLVGRAPLRTPWDLAQHECLGFAHSELLTHWSFDGPEGRVRIPVSSRHVADHGEALLHAAVAGLGIILQPLEVLQPALDDGRLVSVLPGWTVPSRALNLVYAADRRVTPKLRSFIDFAVATFGAPASSPGASLPA